MLEATAPSGAPAISLDPIDSSRVRFDMGHPLMRELSELRRAAPEVAATVAAQLFDSARAAAGVLPDSRVMLPRFVPSCDRDDNSGAPCADTPAALTTPRALALLRNLCYCCRLNQILEAILDEDSDDLDDDE